MVRAPQPIHVKLEQLDMILAKGDTPLRRAGYCIVMRKVVAWEFALMPRCGHGSCISSELDGIELAE
jgi:hypothetical protein